MAHQTYEFLVPSPEATPRTRIIAHVCFGIDWNEVWQVAIRDVGILKPQIEAILAALPADTQTS